MPSVRRMLLSMVSSALLLAGSTAHVHASSWASALAPQEELRDFPYLAPAGDLDGDGASELLSVEEPAPVLELNRLEVRSGEQIVTLRRGRDGSVLWSRSLPGRPTPAALGPQGLAGVAMVEGPEADDGACKAACQYTFSSVGKTSTERRTTPSAVTLTALGGTGQDLWRRDFQPGPGAESLISLSGNEAQGAVYQDQPEFGGVLQATQSPANDLVVGIGDRREIAGQAETTTTVLVIDGSDGRTATSFEVSTAGRQPAAFAGGDLDGDGLDDVLLTNVPDTGRLSAYRGTDATPIWSSPTSFIPRFPRISALGDLDGDGREELLVRGNDDYIDDPERLWVLDGASGTQLLLLPNGHLTAVGDLDLDGRSELVFQESFQADGPGVRYTLFDLDGRSLADRTYTPAFIWPILGLGDLDDDEIAEVGHRIGPSDNEGIVAISGRTLEPVSGGLAGNSLGASLDGRGNDLVLVRPGAGSRLSVTAQDGGTGETLWDTELPVPSELDLERLQVAVAATDANGDGVPDVVVNVLSFENEPADPGPAGVLADAERFVFAWVLDGTSGDTQWSV